MRRIMMLAVLAAGLAASVAPAASAATKHPMLVASRVLVHPDQRLLTLTLRCDAPRARCSGRLGATSLDGVTVARTLTVRLPPHRSRRIAMRLTTGALHALSMAGEDTEVDLTLTPANGAKRLTAYSSPTLRVSCASGATVAVSPRARVFRVRSFGVYACSAPSRRPVRLAVESDGLETAWVGRVALAGRFVAFVAGRSFKCATSGVTLYDLRARRAVRTIPSGTVHTDNINVCENGTLIDALLLRPSGALAWSEQPGDTPRAVRAADIHGPVRTLDVSADIDLTSLRLVDPGAVSWVRAGVVHTAPLA